MSILQFRQRLATAFQHRLGRMLTNGPTRDASATSHHHQTQAPPRTAWVLFGGGSHGAAQAGALTVLLEAGIIPDLIVGISAGAWNGTYLAFDPTPERASELERVWAATTTHDIIGAWPWYSALHIVRHHLSLYDSAAMRRVARRYISGRGFADLRVPLRIVATDLISGRPHIFSEGPLLPAVIASSSVPGIFPPVPGKHELLVDGGPNEWSGCVAALDLGATRICLLACGCQAPAVDNPHNLLQILERSMDVGQCDSFGRTIFALRATGVEVLPVFPQTLECSFLDFNHGAELIACGRAAATRALAMGWNPPRGAWRAGPAPVAESAATARQSA